MQSNVPLAVFGLLTLAPWLVVAAVASVFLFMAYGRTKMSGFLWLFAAVIIWPTITRTVTLALNMSIPRIAAERSMTASAVGAMIAGVTVVETLIGGVILIVAVAILNAEAGKRLAVLPVPLVYPAYSRAPSA